MALTEAKVSCKCGKVVLKFFNPQPKICLECGCVDCKQAMVWGEEQGGPKVCIKKKPFSNFSCMFLNPSNFSNLNYGCSNPLGLKNHQEHVKKALCYQKLF